MMVEWTERVSADGESKSQVLPCSSVQDAEHLIRDSGAPEGTWYWVSWPGDRARKSRAVQLRLGGDLAIFDYE